MPVCTSCKQNWTSWYILPTGRCIYCSRKAIKSARSAIKDPPPIASIRGLLLAVEHAADAGISVSDIISEINKLVEKRNV